MSKRKTIDHVPISYDMWLCSDPHIGHGRIIDYCRRPQDCNERMLEALRTMVKPTDTMLCLGDLTYSGAQGKKYYQQIRELPGNRYLLPGNHDGQPVNFFEKLGFTMLSRAATKKGYRIWMEDGSVVAFSHEPLNPDDSWDINIHGHIHINGYPWAQWSSGKDYRNISMEITQYRPVRLWDVLTNPACYQTPAQAGQWSDGDRMDRFKHYYAAESVCWA